MEHTKLINEAGLAAKKMQKILLSHTEDKKLEAQFKIGIISLSSLLAAFVDAIIVDKAPYQKEKLVMDVLNVTLQMLEVKKQIKSKPVNASDVH